MKHQAEKHRPLVRHFERHLGPIDAGWAGENPGSPGRVQVVRFSAPPTLPGRTIFATLGLSDLALMSATSAKAIRQEFVLVVSDRLRDSPAPSILLDLADERVSSGAALLRGEVVGPRGPLFAMSSLSALYAAIPVVLPDGFEACEIEGGVTAVMTWLVPISHGEAHLVWAAGWEAFEDMLVEQQPDLTDVDRIPVVPG